MGLHSDWKAAKEACKKAGLETKKLTDGFGKQLDALEKAYNAYVAAKKAKAANAGALKTALVAALKPMGPNLKSIQDNRNFWDRYAKEAKFQPALNSLDAVLIRISNTIQLASKEAK
jgi:hypothetical protein